MAATAIQGKNGWLFLSGDTNDAIGQFTGKVRHTEASLEKWVSILKRRRQLCNKSGVPYFFFVVPDTNAIYPEFLPDGVSAAAVRPIDELIEAAWVSSEFEVFYPLTELKREKKRALVCQAADSHLSGFGGWVLAQAALSRINEKIPVHLMSISDIRYANALRIGDLGDKFEPQIAGATTHVSPRRAASSLVYFNNIQNRGGVRIYENENKTLPRCLLFSDSYGHYTAPHFAAAFSRLVYVHSPFFDEKILEEEKPQVVVSVVAERFCISPPEDAENPILSHFIKQKLGQSQLTHNDYPWV